MQELMSWQLSKRPNLNSLHVTGIFMCPCYSPVLRDRHMCHLISYAILVVQYRC